MRERKRNKPAVIFADDSLVVVDKPSGMLVDEVASETGGILVHRLDRDTSGLMVLAKNEQAAEKLRSQFEMRKVNKKYVALVHGQMKQASGLITTPIKRHPKGGNKFTTGEDSDRSAITEWKLIKELNNTPLGPLSLLELKPHTGRTHQLRVHLQSIGHPIVSDPIYGFRKKLKLDRDFCPRLFLHAQYLELTHPQSGSKQSWQSQLPSDLQSVLSDQ